MKQIIRKSFLNFNNKIIEDFSEKIDSELDDEFSLNVVEKMN